PRTSTSPLFPYTTLFRSHSEMLERPVGLSEPTVVRHVHHEARPAEHEATHQCWKDAFVTDDGPERSRRTREDHGARAGLEIRDEDRKSTRLNSSHRTISY